MKSFFFLWFIRYFDSVQGHTTQLLLTKKMLKNYAFQICVSKTLILKLTNHESIFHLFLQRFEETLSAKNIRVVIMEVKELLIF